MCSANRPFSIKGISFIFIILFFLIIQSCGKKDIEYVATVGNHRITSDQFKERLERFLSLGSTRDNLLLRKNILDNMVREHLLLAQAQDQGFKQDLEYQRQVESIKKQVLLDAYRRKVVFDSISVSEDEIRKAFLRLNQKVSARHLYAWTEDKAHELLRLLRDGASFEELAATTFQDSTLASNGGYLGYFGMGEMDPAFEEVAFSLKVGEISDPIKTQYGYSIIKVEDRIQIPLATEYEYQNKKENLRKAIKRIKSIRASKQLASDLAKSISTEFQPQALQFLINQLQENRDSTFLEIAPDKGELERDFQNALQEELVRFNDGVWSIRDFIEQLQSTSIRQRNRINNIEDLKASIQGLIVREKLLQNARNEGLHKDDEVHRSIQHQIEGYLISRLRKMIVDTVRVPEQALQAHYQEHQNTYYFPEQVNVREILLKSKENVQTILVQVEKGEDFAQLARKHSIREWAAERGGELGYGHRGKYGALADTIFALKVGDVIGPLEIAGYYSIVKLIDRKEKRQKTFNEAKEQIESELNWKWKETALRKYVYVLEQRFKVDIDSDRIKDLTLTE